MQTHITPSDLWTGIFRCIFNLDAAKRVPSNNSINGDKQATSLLLFPYDSTRTYQVDFQTCWGSTFLLLELDGIFNIIILS